jgi:hypothetical protein
MRPTGIVEKGASELVPMDHNALFTTTVTIGGVAVSGVAGIDCSTCHKQPGGNWSDGVFHASIGAAVPKDCAVCHDPLMADAAVADVTSATSYRMQHRSTQVTTQNCQTCHTGALAQAATQTPTATQWKPGAFHASVATTPSACIDCHSVSRPAQSTQSDLVYALSLGGTASNGAQWMSHAASYVVGRDCAACHAAQAGTAFSKSTRFHVTVAPTTCRECHGLTNGGGAVPGTGNNMPATLTNSTTASTASADTSTGVPAGTLDQISHADVNVTGHDCNFCHTQVGPSSTAGITGKEWAQASFHVHFDAANPLVINGTSGRCSSCHMNVKPGAGFTPQDHSSFTSASGTTDCSACHSYPGTGTTSAPNWLGAAGGAPQYLNVGGFTIPRPPAGTVATQSGIANLPHPTVGSNACTTCHATSAGGRGAKGYDHASALINANCAACHEAGSDLIGTIWNGATTQAAGAGDSRPFTLSSVVASRGNGTLTVTKPNHFYPVDCAQCHVKPSGIATITTGATYTSAWTFPHNTGAMTNPSTCNLCHN